MSNPWVGPEYAQTGLLLLGESAYSWEENGVLRHPSSDHASEMVEWVKDRFEDANGFMRMLSRGITGTSTPSAAQLAHAWDRVAFTNYVGGTVGTGPRVRPSESMWNKAQRHFLDVTLPTLQPRRIIVLGKTMWSRMPETTLYLTDDVQGYGNPDGTTAMCWAVNHPSRGLSWSQLAAIAQFGAERELRS